MPNIPQEEISCIGISYLNPILDLYATLKKTNFSGNSIIRVSSNENGYSVSIVALVVFCIESYVNNLQYRLNEQYSDPLKFLNKNYPKNKKLFDKINELIVLRNAIAHNHIWKINYETNELFDELNIQKTLLDGYGRGAFNEVVNHKTRETKILKLRIIPTRIGKPEAEEALKILDEFSNFINSLGFGSLLQNSFLFCGESRSLKEIVKLQISNS